MPTRTTRHPANSCSPVNSENWRRMLVTGELTVNIALVTKQISVKGKMGPLLKNIPQFNYIIVKLSELGPRALDQEAT
ncbi:hypothetical protein RHA1_ro08053 (plasmid) [Rhodococcus jostii RHA1]|uniref:SCP2 domain-containing protein n=2 Tax=Rhodococcus jostii TaxID=132919 RepID=Q0S036_RHOJR|nr:hypothetical protein RHA1_ro08053 [Rhodococcus jostii RHA1]